MIEPTRRLSIPFMNTPARPWARSSTKNSTQTRGWMMCDIPIAMKFTAAKIWAARCISRFRGLGLQPATPFQERHQAQADRELRHDENPESVRVVREGDVLEVHPVDARHDDEGHAHRR